MDNWQGFYDLAIIASNSNADHLITGTGSIFKSTNGAEILVFMVVMEEIFLFTLISNALLGMVMTIGLAQMVV